MTGGEERTPLVAGTSDPVGSGEIHELVPLRRNDCTGVADQDKSGRKRDQHDRMQDDEDQLSWRGVFAHSLKMSVGLAVLSFPHAISLTGITGGLVMLILLATITTHCLHILVKCADVLAKRYGRCQPSYGEVGELAMHKLSGKFDNYKHITRVVINGFVFFSFFGTCPAAMSFFGTNLQRVLSACGLAVNYRLILLAFLPMFVLGSFIRKLQTLVVFSSVGIFLEIISQLIMVQFFVRHLHWDEVKQFPSSWAGISETFGTFLFPLGISPLVISMRNRGRKVIHFNWAVSFAMVTNICLTGTFGVLGYVGFPHHPHGSITLSLPTTGEAKNIPYLIVLLYYSAATVCHFLLVLYPISSAIDDHLNSEYHCYSQMKWSSEMMRFLLVLLSFLLSIAVPNVAWIIALVGSVGCSGVALVFPPFIELATFGRSLPKWSVFKNVCIFIVGLLGMCFGVITSIRTF